MEKIINLLITMDAQIGAIKEYASDITDIANLPSNTKETTTLLLQYVEMIEKRIDDYDTYNKTILGLIEDGNVRKNDTPSPSGVKPIFEDKQTQTDFEVNKDQISLRPQTSKMISDEKRIRFDFGTQHPFVELQSSKMRELYNLSDTSFRYVDFSGVYPRINYLQDAPCEEIRYWYDFGAINSIYLTSPDFREINMLPQWIKEGVKNCYLNNPTILRNDIMVLKFISAGPDFHGEDRYPAYHFIQVGKSESFSITAIKQKKEFIKFDEKDIHYRRAIGIRVVLQGMEASFKKGFRTYGGNSVYSSVMISFAKESPKAALGYLGTKINLLDKGTIKSSPYAQARICQYRQHTRDMCPACTAPTDKVKAASSNNSTKFEDME